jgi:hypothetical protein
MEPRNVRETIVASAIVRLRAVCMLVARVGKPGTRPTRIPIDDSPHAPRVNKPQPRLIAQPSCGNMPNDRCSSAIRGGEKNK